MEWYIVLALIGVGFAAGFINTFAGSGSLLSLSLLMFLGLPANVANGTNRVAILLQNVVGVSTFHKEKLFDYKLGWKYGIYALVGSLAGAQVAVELNDEVMEKVIGGLFIVMFVIILLRPNVWLKGKAGNVKKLPNYVQFIIFFFIGFYGGFIQAGVGFFILAGLVLGAGLDLMSANPLKLFIVLLYIPFTLVIYFIHGQVDLKLGLLLALGNMSGAFVASKLAIRWGVKFMRIFLMAVLIFASLHLFGVVEI
jgi:hypothetical protein